MGNSPTPLFFQARHASRELALDCLVAEMSGTPNMQAAEAWDVKTLNPFCNSHSMNLSGAFRAMGLRCSTSGRLHHRILSVKKYVGHFQRWPTFELHTMCTSHKLGETGTGQYRSQCLVLQLLRHPSPLDFEMAYQARVAVEPIRFAIRSVQQIRSAATCLKQASPQLLDAFDSPESAFRHFQHRFRSDCANADNEARQEMQGLRSAGTAQENHIG